MNFNQLNIMTKYLFSILFCMLALVGYAQKEATMYVDGSLKVKPGEQVKASFQLKNNFEVIGAAFKVYLPTGVSLVSDADDYLCTTNPDRVPKKYQIGEVLLSTGDGYSIEIGSDGTKPIIGTEGELFSLTFKVDETISLGDLKIGFKDVSFQYMSDVSTDYEHADFDVPLKVYATYDISAVSSNEVMGAATVTHSGLVENGTSVTATATPVAGYEFVNWTVGDDVKSTENPYTFTAAENVALVANFKVRKYDVTFDVDGEKTTSTLDFASVIPTPKSPAKTGYTFAGWNPEFVEGATVPVDGITYTATWTINQYTLTFDTNGGSEVAPITQDYATEVTAPANPTKTGYTFTGWDKEIPATMPAEEMTIKAQWTINQYTVAFVSDEETLKSETLDYGTVITAPKVPEKEEYYFTGWSPDFAEGTTVPAHNITYTAVWAPVQHSYTITFDTDGGSEIEPIIQDAGTEVTPPANPTKTGYTFAGWDKELPVTMPSEDMTLKAQWTINQYTVMFISDGKTITSQRLDYGTVITTPPLSNKKGYTFKGWSPAFFKDTTVPAHDVTYNALWSVNQYTITFDTDGGSEIAPIIQNYESAVMAPVIPTKTGYTFAGWDREFPVIMPAENITLKAQWTLSQYTITFDTDGGSEVAPITQDYTSAVTAPADPTKTGYTFAGWNKEIPTTMPAENMTVKAQWTVNQYTVKFVADGTVVSEATLDFGSAITVPEAPAKEGYTFKGWSPEVDETVPANDMEYVAEYTVNSYKLTYVLDGVEVKALDVEYGAEIEDFVPEVETGRIFDGWTDEIPETMPARDLTINGKTSVDTFIRAHFATSSEGIEVYTANGSRVTPLNKADDINRLSRGTYIINGRKVVIRK